MTRARVYLSVVFLLALVGFALSVVSLDHYVKIHYALSSEPSFCNINAAFDCDAVSRSEWSEFLGVPLASWGMLFYGALGALALIARGGAVMAYSTARSIVLWSGIVTSILSLALFYISKAYIGTVCLVCTAMYVVNFLLLGVGFLMSRREEIVADLGHGISLPLAFLGRLLGVRGAVAERRTVWWFVLFLVFLAGGAYAAEGLLAARAPKAPSAPGYRGDVPKLDPVAIWRTQKLDRFDPQVSGLYQDYSIGSLDAPVTIVEFSDYECPACKVFHTIVKNILESEPAESVRVVHKDYPLDSSCNDNLKEQMHENACYAAELARCAGEQGRFAEVSDFLFELPAGHRDGAAVERAKMFDGALGLGLDRTALQECLDSDRHMAKIASDIQEARGLRVTGTPSVWVNGRRTKQLGEQALRDIVRAAAEERR